MDTHDLAAWLRAQLDEDERLAHEALRENPLYIPMCLHVPPEVAMHNAHHHPARVLVEVEAKRRILDLWDQALRRRKEHPDDVGSAGALLALLGVVKTLALPYATRPGWRDEWGDETSATSDTRAAGTT